MLTDLQVKSLPEGFHRADAGLYLRVRGKARSWVIRKQVNGRRKDTTIGRYPAMSLADARLATLQGAGVPGAVGVPTFGAAVKDYVIASEGRWRGPREASQTINQLEKWWW